MLFWDNVLDCVFQFARRDGAGFLKMFAKRFVHFRFAGVAIAVAGFLYRALLRGLDPIASKPHFVTHTTLNYHYCTSLF